MHRFLERWETSIRQLIPAVYLAAMLFSTVAFFTGTYLGGRLVVGAMAAIAFEAHTFFQQRLVRQNFVLWLRERGKAPLVRLWASIIPLVALLTFQSVNSLVFTATTYHPTPALPAQVQIVMLGLSVPLLLLAAGFLIPTETNPADVLTAASRAMLGDTLLAVKKQWRERVTSAKSTGASLVPAAQALLQDAGLPADAQRLHIMDHAIPGAKPTGGDSQPKTKRRPPTRRRSEIDSERERRYAILREHMTSHPKTTLSQAQALLGMKNRAGAQTVWRDVRAELGIVPRKIAS